MERISQRPQSMRQRYEVVIVGSGYGGAIMASRLARAGRDVCLVERGEEILPGDYPGGPISAVDDIQVNTAERRIGSRQALFDFNIHDDISVFKGCGLGGTSLVNANVAIEPDPRIFDDPKWPAALRTDLAAMDDGFRRARHMLGSTPYPQDRSPLAKTTMLERQAKGVGEPFLLPPLNVTFEDRVNEVGIDQPACNGCGDCVTGCNVGAKNTLLMNYLPDAHRWGAQIFTGVDVRWVERSGDTWAVRYHLLDAGRGRFGEDPMTVCGDIVVLAGGTLGSTEILLRSARKGLPVSTRVGSAFSGNGDVLGFAFDCDETVNGIGGGPETGGGPPVGPCITGVIDGRSGHPLDEGVIIEEGSIPGALAHAVVPGFALAQKDPDDPVSTLRRVKQAAQALLGGPYRGPMRRTQTFLVMGSETGAGLMRLNDDDRLDISWPDVGREHLFTDIIDEKLEAAAEAVDGTYIPNPMWLELRRRPLVTVHPLGGCPMGESAETGAVDHIGAVFAGPTGTDVHDGLFVCDGAVIPRPLGVNPLLTISALAERTAAGLADVRGWTIDYDGTPARRAARPGPVSGMLLEFTEKMTGWIGRGEEDVHLGAAKGRADRIEMIYELTMGGDAKEVTEHPDAPTRAIGTITCSAISDTPMSVADGWFRLFVDNDDGTGDARMVYEMPMRAIDGRRFHLSGYKDIRRSTPGNLWPDTSTLFTTIRHDGPDGPIWGAGILRIAPLDFAKQMTTMRVSGPAPLPRRLAALTRYGRMFAGELWDFYVAPLAGRTDRPVTAGAAGVPGVAGLRLDEQLTGSWSPDDDRDAGDLGQYLAADEAGEAEGRRLALDLTLASGDVEAVIRDLATPMVVTGTVSGLGDLGGDDVAIADGRIELVAGTTDPDVRNMRYSLGLPGADLHLSGFKVLTEGDVTQLWGASTTLYVTIHRHDAAGPVVGRGVARLSPGGFVRQLRSMDITGADGELEQLALLARFGASFFGALWDDYGSVVARSTRLRRSAPPRLHRPLDAPVPQVVGYRTADGKDLRLTRYHGGDRGPVVLVHGMGGNPRTYTADTIQPNLLEHLVGHGFDVWLQEWRGSTLLPTAREQFDCDMVARFDHPAAEAAVREATGRSDVHWVTHCVGSMTWMMSVLGGWTTPASLVLSSVAAHPVAATLTRMKALLRAPNLLRRLGVRFLTTDSYDDGSLGARVFDQLLRLHPIPRSERCASAVCRRLAFTYGVAVHHPAVDDATHDALHELFGVTNMKMMSHLGRCAAEERLVTADGRDAYLPHVERARLPMTLIHGEHNLVWVPESTRRSYDWLVSALGPEGFTREVFDQHGHQDSLMGAEAHEKVFPAILAHLQRAGC